MEASRVRGQGGAPSVAALESSVRVPHNRCPYCHTQVSIDAEDWLACRRCLARQHLDCREEAGACGSCGDTGPTLVLREEPRFSVRSRPRPTARPPLLLFAAAAVFVLGLLATTFVSSAPPRSQDPSLKWEVAGPARPAPDYLLEQLDFLESEGLYRTAIGKIESSDFRSALQDRLARYRAELRR